MKVNRNTDQRPPKASLRRTPSLARNDPETFWILCSHTVMKWLPKQPQSQDEMKKQISPRSDSAQPGGQSSAWSLRRLPIPTRTAVRISWTFVLNSAFIVGARLKYCPVLLSTARPALYNTTRYCSLLFNPVQYCDTLYNTFQHLSVLFSQCCTIQYSWILFSTVL